MDDVCSVCFDDHNESSVKLFCNHYLHKNCLRNLSRKVNGECKCPLCREVIIKDFIEFLLDNECNKCSLCDNQLGTEEDDMNMVELMQCGCKFHYNCWKNFLMERFKDDINSEFILPMDCFINCPKCSEKQLYYNVNARDYSYLKNGHLLWIGKIEKCKHKDCIYLGNPQRWGYCLDHFLRKSSNHAIKNILRFMLKVAPFWSFEKKMKHFYNLLDKFEEDWDIYLDTDLKTFVESLEGRVICI